MKRQRVKTPLNVFFFYLCGCKRVGILFDHFLKDGACVVFALCVCRETVSARERERGTGWGSEGAHDPFANLPVHSLTD